MSHLLEGIVNLPPALVLVLTFLFPALEASTFIGVVVPGEIGVIIGGVLVNQGKLPLWAVLVAAICGAIIGDSIGFEVGKRWGEAILRKLPDRLVGEDRMHRAEATLRRYGGRAVFLGRFTAALRAIIPGAAGMSKLPYRTFLPWNALGGATWATAFVLLGYLAGSQYQRIESYANYIALALLAGIVILLFVRHRKHKASEI